MATYVILSRFSPDAFRDPGEFKQLAATVAEKINLCPSRHHQHSVKSLRIEIDRIACARCLIARGNIG